MCEHDIFRLKKVDLNIFACGYTGQKMTKKQPKSESCMIKGRKVGSGNVEI